MMKVASGDEPQMKAGDVWAAGVFVFLTMLVLFLAPFIYDLWEMVFS